jgi:hypothetical protein
LDLHTSKSGPKVPTLNTLRKKVGEGGTETPTASTGKTKQSTNEKGRQETSSAAQEFCPAR